MQKTTLILLYIDTLLDEQGELAVAFKKIQLHDTVSFATAACALTPCKANPINCW